jgi:hypothetical protein
MRLRAIYPLYDAAGLIDETTLPGVCLCRIDDPAPLLRSLRGMQGLFELPERVAAGMKCA